MPRFTPRSIASRCPPAVAETAFNSAPNYIPGTTFKWTLEEGYNRTIFSGPTVQLTILELISCTSSPVMRVRFQTARGPRTAILKTYDRRMGNWSRMVGNEMTPRPYESASDPDVVKFVHEGKAKDLFQQFKQQDWDGVRVPTSTRARITHEELYFQSQRLKEWENETEAYRRMAHVQGQDVPFFMGTMHWRPTCANAEDLKIGAILIEEIRDATTLKEYLQDHHIGENLWSEIKQHERRLHRELRDVGIQDMDRHEGNTLIVPINMEVGEYRLLQIDFGFATVTPMESMRGPSRRDRQEVIAALVRARRSSRTSRRRSSRDFDDFNIPHQRDLQRSRLREWLNQLE